MLIFVVWKMGILYNFSIQNIFNLFKINYGKIGLYGMYPQWWLKYIFIDKFNWR